MKANVYLTAYAEICYMSLYDMERLSISWNTYTLATGMIS
jgi:hypothetical protein